MDHAQIIWSGKTLLLPAHMSLAAELHHTSHVMEIEGELFRCKLIHVLLGN